MTIPIVPKLLRAHLGELAANDARIDGRDRWEGRELEVEHSVLPWRTNVFRRGPTNCR